MPGLTTEGLILKRINFGEADRVITALTPRLGKISIIARGVRRITSRRAGNVEVLNRVKLHLFKGKSYTLTEAESIQTYSKLKENLVLTSAAFHIIELVDRLTVEGVVNKNLYELTVGVLGILAKNPRQIFIRAYEVKVLSMLGFWSTEGISDIDPHTRDLLFKLEYNSWSEIDNLKIVEDQAIALEKVLRYYLEKTIEGKLRSLDVLKKLKA